MRASSKYGIEHGISPVGSLPFRVGRKQSIHPYRIEQNHPISHKAGSQKRQARFSTDAMFNIWRNIRVEVSQEHERMTVGGKRLYVADILQGSFILHFSSKA